jgi:hypothetical protein
MGAARPRRRAPDTSVRAPTKRRGAGSLAGGADAYAGGPPDAPARAWLTPTALGSVVEVQCLDARWAAALAAVAEVAYSYPPTRPLAGQRHPAHQGWDSAPRPLRLIARCARSPTPGRRYRSAPGARQACLGGGAALFAASALERAMRWNSAS